MNNDRELLEQAAKAAGIEYTGEGYARAVLSAEHGHYENYPWNPLTDDGDALRLAVKLNMNIYTGHKRASAEIISDSDEPSICITMLHDNDPYAATRRAIVRAAAEIGKASDV